MIKLRFELCLTTVLLLIIAHNGIADGSSLKLSKNTPYKIPSGSVAYAKLIENDPKPNKKYDLVYKITTPFIDNSGFVSVDNIILLVKIVGGKNGVIVEGKRFVPESILDVFIGRTNATVNIAYTETGSILKSLNDNVIIKLDSDLILNYMDGNVAILSDFEAEAKSGNVESMTTLGFYYEIGGVFGVKKNEEIAMDWYKKASSLGHSPAMVALAEIYMRNKDYSKAFSWYQKAAENNYPHAYFAMAIMYYQGWHVSKNTDKAVELLMKGARHGSPLAMRLLGLMYATGECVPMDTETSYVFLLLAAAKNKDFSKERDLVEKQLSPQQIISGQKKASEWHIKDMKGKFDTEEIVVPRQYY